jgi:hypothetical protein
MSNDQENKLDRKFNKLFVTVIAVLSIFIALFITFMVSSSKKDGIQDTQISNIAKLQEENSKQVKEIAKAVNILITEKAVLQTQYNSLLGVVVDNNEKAQKLEWAVLTGDKSIITRNAKIKK